MIHKAIFRLNYSKEEWKSLGLWTRFKLRFFALMWKEILQIDVGRYENENIRIRNQKNKKAI